MLKRVQTHNTINKSVDVKIRPISFALSFFSFSVAFRLLVVFLFFFWLNVVQAIHTIDRNYYSKVNIFYVYLFSWFWSNRRITNKTCFNSFEDLKIVWSLLKFLFPVFIWRHHLISEIKGDEEKKNIQTSDWLSCSCFYQKLWISLIFEHNALKRTTYTIGNQIMTGAFAHLMIIWLFFQLESPYCWIHTYQQITLSS